MSKSRYIRLIILLFLVAISNVLVFKYCNLENQSFTLRYTVVSDKEDTYQVFYGNEPSWTGERSQEAKYSNINKKQTLKYFMPQDSIALRFDFGNKISNINISNIELSSYFEKVNLPVDQMLESDRQVDISRIIQKGNSLEIETAGDDPYITYIIDSDIYEKLKASNIRMSNLLKIFLCIIIDILIFIIFVKSKDLIALIKEVNKNRILVWNLSKNDFKTKYAGSYLGITWAFVQPIITILIYWFVFGFGLKAGSPIQNVPYILWFMSGLIPWFFFQEALINATNCMLEYSYLVKKVVFKISILPIVKIMSSVFVHLVFIGFLLIISAIYGFYPYIYTIQILYYSFCTFCMVLAISYATCAIVIFFKDLGQLIQIFLQIGMWMTPIMWSSTSIPKQFQWIVKLNPIYYIVEGYRDTIINNVWFFQKYFQTIYFWAIILALFMIGIRIFKKLKPHFADVL